jgi:hypothetical protein
MNDPLRVLIVDDEPLARQAIRILLRADPDVAIAGECSGAEAAAIIEKTPPDILFLDIHMPEVDGFGLLEGGRNRARAHRGLRDRLCGPRPAGIRRTCHRLRSEAARRRALLPSAGESQGPRRASGVRIARPMHDSVPCCASARA